MQEKEDGSVRQTFTIDGLLENFQEQMAGQPSGFRLLPRSRQQRISRLTMGSNNIGFFSYLLRRLHVYLY